MGIGSEKYKVGVRPVSAQREIVSFDGMKSLADEQILEHVLNSIHLDTSSISIGDKNVNCCMCIPTDADAEAQRWTEIKGTYYDCFKQPHRDYLFDRNEFSEYCQLIADTLYNNGIRVYRFDDKNTAIASISIEKTMIPTAILVEEMLTHGLDRYAAVIQ